MVAFKKEGFLWRIAYGHPMLLSKPDDGQITSNLCAFFWKVVFGLLVFWPPRFLGRILGYVVRIVGAPIALFCGYRPAGCGWRLVTSMEWKREYSGGPKKLTIVTQDPPLPFVPIEPWPRWRGFRMTPLVVIGVPTALLLIVAAVCATVWGIVNIGLGLLDEYVLISTFRTCVFWVILLGAGFFVVIRGVREAEWVRLVRTYMTAKAGRFCPTVYFK